MVTPDELAYVYVCKVSISWITIDRILVELLLVELVSVEIEQFNNNLLPIVELVLVEI